MKIKVVAVVSYFCQWYFEVKMYFRNVDVYVIQLLGLQEIKAFNSVPQTLEIWYLVISAWMWFKAYLSSGMQCVRFNGFSYCTFCNFWTESRKVVLMYIGLITCFIQLSTLMIFSPDFYLAITISLICLPKIPNVYMHSYHLDSI